MGQSKTKVKIVVCGLDNSGKSTLINQLKPDSQRRENIAATVGYSTEMFTKGKIQFTAFDMGGARQFRSLWENHYASVQGVIFVIDSTDILRLCLVRDEIQQMIENTELQENNPPFLLFANKKDIHGAKTPHEINEALELNTLMKNNAYHFFASDALHGSGLNEGIAWLEQEILRIKSRDKA